MYTLHRLSFTEQITAYDLLHAELKSYAEIATNFISAKEYTEELERYEAIASSDFYVVWNKQQELDADDVRDILYAMSQHKPIVMLDLPRFTADVNHFGRELIRKGLSKILLCDITLLDSNDLESLTHSIVGYPTNYLLTQHERSLIRSAVKSYFRDLLIS